MCKDIEVCIIGRGSRDTPDPELETHRIYLPHFFPGG